MIATSLCNVQIHVGSVQEEKVGQRWVVHLKDEKKMARLQKAFIGNSLLFALYCRASISDNEAFVGSGQAVVGQNREYCKLVNGWVRSKSRIRTG